MLYHVESIKSSFWGGKLKPAKIQQILTTTAKDGWEYKNTVITHTGVFFRRSTYSFIFEKK